ncbi:GAF domain-containing protein [Belnapia moabensis]|uniref:GAF domain-containing protein n=1 Tax=Belnapia moabensis TaxID=365533 RepID=UPI0009FDC63A|nr:GAF domain-containing protein [Belnapia moabensis]
MDRQDDPDVASSDDARRQALVASFGSRALEEGRDLDGLLADAAEHAALGLCVKRAKVLQYRPEAGDLLVRAGVGWAPGVVGRTTLSAGMTSPPGRALKTGETVSVADITRAEGFEYSEVLRQHSIVSLLNVPVPAGSGAWGVLEVDAATPRCFGHEHEHFLRSLAGLLGAAIHRLRVEAELRESEARLRALADNLPAGMVYQLAMQRDGSERRFVYVSRGCERLTGVSVEAALADPGALYQTIAPEHREELAAAEWAAIGDLAHFDREVPFTRADGQARWGRIVSAPRRMPDGSLVWDGLLVDVTDRRAAIDALRDEAHRLEVLNRTGALLAAELDLERIVQAVTDAATELSGAAFGAFFYNTTSERGEALSLYSLSGAPRSAFERFPMPRGTAVFGPTLAGEGIVRSSDILTDPRYGQNAPHHGMPEGHLPVRSYLAVPVSSRSGEVLGGLFFGHPEPGIFSERAEHLVVGIASQAAVAIDNARLYQAAQREIAARAAAEADLQRLNETLERRVAEEVAERFRAEEALRQAQKMEAIGQLTGGLAHDFNNLLQGVVGSLHMLRSRAAAGRTADLGRYVDAALTSADRAAALTHRLLAFARRQPLDPKPVDVNRLVSSLEDLVRRTAGPAIRVEVVLAGGLWPTLCDRHQLENALLNLCINARDAMLEGGILTIETANAHLDDSYAAAQRDVEPGQYVAVCVTDTGMGMPPDVVGRAFDPFFTTKPLGQGTGLGLSMVYGFVRQSGGHVRIYSEEERGTTVKLYLPRHRGPAESETELEVQARQPCAVAGETVLVVEDEAVIRLLVVEVLEELGYTPLEAPDAAAGLRILETDTRIDLLVTDVGLPGGMNGRQLADAARRIRPELKVLFMTGYAQNAAFGNGVLEPGMALVTKPFALDTLAAKICSMIEDQSSRKGLASSKDV